MQCWLRKLFKSGELVTAQHDREAERRTKPSAPCVRGAPASPPPASPRCSPPAASRGRAPAKRQRSQPALSSRLRWSLRFDVLVCHSSVRSDAEEAARMVSFLEAPPRSLRCFLRHRDDCPGGAVSTELCQAVRDSHVWALLITPDFLKDEWCMYVMHQALVEGPTSNRIIPMVKDLSRSQYPKELTFYTYSNLSTNPVRGYALLSQTVSKYLEELVERKGRTLDCNMDSPGSPAETSDPLEVMKKRDESFCDVLQ